MSGFHRVHFASGPIQSPQPTSNSITTWSQRHGLLSKLSTALAQHIQPHHSNQNSQHLQRLLKQINSNHALNPQLGWLVEASYRLLQTSSSNLNFTSSTPPQTRLMERAIKCQLDPNVDFVVIRELSSSESGKVEVVRSWLSKDKRRNQRNVFVLKTIFKSAAVRMREHISPDAELAILQLSRSQAGANGLIPNLRASFQSSEALYLLMSYIPGGTLAHFLVSRQQLRSRTQQPSSVKDSQLESVVRQWSTELVVGLNWLHETHAWVHRDLKPSNILLASDGHVVLTDFGTAAPLIKFDPPISDDYHLEQYREEVVYQYPKAWVPKRYSRTLVGTCDYIAPEILHSHLHTVMDIMDDEDDSNAPSADQDDSFCPGSYGNEVDWWSLGITLYELLYGKPPFYSPAISTTYDQIVSHEKFLRFPNVSEVMPTCAVTAHAKNFIKSLLSPRYRRIGCNVTGVAEIQNHPWFRGVDWQNLRTVETRFKPPHEPLEMDAEEFVEDIQLASAIPARVAAAFNFSAFFASSPGLSVLRSARRPRSGDDDEEEEDDEEALSARARLWEGFTLLPRHADEFETDDDHSIVRSVKALKSSMSGPNRLADRFVTPIRPRRERTGNGTVAEPLASGSGIGRGMSELEEWKELIDHVTMTAQKRKHQEHHHHQRESGDGWESLRRRCDELVENVETIVERHQGLFELIEAG